MQQKSDFCIICGCMLVCIYTQIILCIPASYTWGTYWCILELLTDHLTWCVLEIIETFSELICVYGGVCYTSC
jgi:hypothetical protein